MRKQIFLIPLLLPLFSYSQVNIINRSLIDSNLNIVYIGVDNEIELTGLKSFDNLSFSTTNGRLIELAQNRYILNFFEKGECILSLKKKEKLIAQKTFKAAVIPDPHPRFSSQYDSISKKGGYTYYISYNNLIKDPVFRVEAPNCYFRQPWKILSYRITLEDTLSSNGSTTELVVPGAELNEEQIQIIKKYGGNTFMVIDQIRVEGPDSRKRQLIPQIFMIN